MKKPVEMSAMEDLMGEAPEAVEGEAEAKPAAPKADPTQLLASIESKLAQLRELLG